jgi:hypothetical protein
MRKCSHCKSAYVDEDKQTFIYRCHEGNKWDARIRPVCIWCIDDGYMKIEDGSPRLHLTRSSFRDFEYDQPNYEWG